MKEQPIIIQGGDKLKVGRFLHPLIVIPLYIIGVCACIYIYGLDNIAKVDGILMALTGLIGYYVANRGSRIAIGVDTPKPRTGKAIRTEIQNTIRDVLRECQYELRFGRKTISVEDLVKMRIGDKGKIPALAKSVLVQTVVSMLNSLGTITLRGKTVEVSQETQLAFLGSLHLTMVHKRQLIRELSAGRQTEHSLWAASLVKRLEEDRTKAIKIPSRRVIVSLAVIKRNIGHTSYYLMRKNRRWHGGMWWFIARTQKSRFGDSSELVSDNDELKRHLRRKVAEELHLEEDSLTLVAGKSPRPDTRHSERLGSYTDYRFLVFGIKITTPPGITERMKSLSWEEYSGIGHPDEIRSFRWMSWSQIHHDSPHTRREPNIIASMKDIVTATDFPLIAPDSEVANAKHRDKEEEFDCLVCDAGGVLFRERFWLQSLQQRFDEYRSALPPDAVSLEFEHFGMISRLISALSHPNKGIDTQKLVGRVYKAYGAKFKEKQFDKKKGLLREGVKETLIQLQALGKKVYVHSGAQLSGDEFKSIYEGTFSHNGVRLIEDFITSRDTGETKFSKTTFEKIEKKWNLNKKKTLFVCHDLPDILGASLVGGFKVLATNVHKTEELLAEEFADYQCTDFKDLIEVLGWSR